MCSSAFAEAVGSIVDEMKHIRDECNGQVSVPVNTITWVIPQPILVCR